jgi:hypothetical protein
MAVETERIVYEESVRTVEGQRDLLEGVRARAGTLLATAFVATAFFGAQALDRHSPDALEWIAVALFLTVIVSTLVVLTPWRLQFEHHPHSLITYHLDLETPRQSAHVYRELAYWNGVHYDRNGRKLEVLVTIFAIACASLVGEVIVWLIALGGT